jgi:hypothetical protein
MTNPVIAKPSFIRDVLEAEVCRHPDWWIKVHSAEKMADSNTRQCFTTAYELKINGEMTGFRVKFYYDYRDNKAEARFDPVTQRVMEHQNDKDFDLQKIDAYIKKFVQTHRPSKPWYKYLKD